MAKVVIVSDSEYEGLKERLGTGIAVIVPESTAKKYEREDIKKAAEEYTAGGDADCWVDFAGDNNHFFFSKVREKLAKRKNKKR